MRIFSALPMVRRSIVHVWVAGVFVLSAAGAARAQDQTSPATDRVSLLTAERDQKATELAPPDRSPVERALYWYDNQYVLPRIFGGWKGFHLAGGDFPAGAGTKLGVGYTKRFGPQGTANRANRLEIDTVAAYSTRGYSRAAATLGLRRLGGAPLDLRVRAQRYEFPQEDFFGIGQDSHSANRTSYLLESTEAGADLLWRPTALLEIGGGLSYLTPRVGAGTDSRFPSTEALFDPASTPGLAEQTDFVRGDASAALDWRDNPQHPHAGGRYGVQLSSFRDQELDAFSFHRLAIDLQQYVPIPNRYRTIALRAAAVLTDPSAGQQVPFFYEPTLGGSQALRGFREFRFRDRNSLLLTAEYRWEASWMLDGALFVDAGKVAADRKDLDLRNLDVSYGIGFRLHSNRAFVSRLDLAFSREGFIPLLRFEHVF
jgi:hypothetical protein